MAESLLTLLQQRARELIEKGIRPSLLLMGPDHMKTLRQETRIPAHVINPTYVTILVLDREITMILVLVGKKGLLGLYGYDRIESVVQELPKKLGFVRFNEEKVLDTILYINNLDAETLYPITESKIDLNTNTFMVRVLGCKRWFTQEEVISYPHITSN